MLRLLTDVHVHCLWQLLQHRSRSMFSYMAMVPSIAAAVTQLLGSHMSAAWQPNTMKLTA